MENPYHFVYTLKITSLKSISLPYQNEHGISITLHNQTSESNNSIPLTYPLVNLPFFLPTTLWRAEQGTAFFSHSQKEGNGTTKTLFFYKKQLFFYVTRASSHTTTGGALQKKTQACGGTRVGGARFGAWGPTGVSKKNNS